MELVALIFAGISAIAAVISAIAALLAKSEVNKLRIQISNNDERSVTGKTNAKIESNTKNSGFIAGVNTGDVNVKEEK